MFREITSQPSPINVNKNIKTKVKVAYMQYRKASFPDLAVRSNDCAGVQKSAAERAGKEEVVIVVRCNERRERGS
jgi:hypothetical protein